MTGMKESSDCYFQPDIPTTLVDENPAPSVDKVFFLGAIYGKLRSISHFFSRT